MNGATIEAINYSRLQAIPCIIYYQTLLLENQKGETQSHKITITATKLIGKLIKNPPFNEVVAAKPYWPSPFKQGLN